MEEQNILISEATEEKRLKDFKKIAENWDRIPEYERGRLDGTITTLATVYLGKVKGVR